MIRFGPWSTLLSLGVAFGLAIASALALQRSNRLANRLLAALMVVMAAKLVPYALGYAGYYDAYPGLSFAPFDVGLAVGPLLWLHVQALTTGRLPARWGLHLLPAALQIAYDSVCFVQPLAWKNDWDQRMHEPWIDPVEVLLTLVSLAVYLRLAWRSRTRYQAWLQANVSNADEHGLRPLRNLIAMMGAVWLLYAGFELATRSMRLDYYDRFPHYLALTVLLYALGLEGWRQADRAHPHADAQPLDALAAATRRPPPDWAALGRDWRARLEAAGWWRDPELSLDTLARRLGTNTSYLSRAFNEGLGANFAQVIGEIRTAWVQAELRRPDAPADLLSLGLAAGFSSKTTFNRVFKAVTGQTPSAWRAAARRTES